MTLRTVLLSIQALLQAAEPDNPQDAVVARQYKEDPELYKKTARHWAQVYAGGERGERNSEERKGRTLGEWWVLALGVYAGI